MRFKSPLLLDGGLSQQLQAQGLDLNHPLWTGQVLLEQPEEIKRAHLAFLEAGARCLITSSYQISSAGLMKMGLNEAEVLHIFRQSVSLAKEARAEFLEKNIDGGPIYIAVSIGPYGATLSDGSEYRGDDTLSEQELLDFHAPRFAMLDELEADCYACETIPSLREARVLAELLAQSKTAGWITFTCKDEKHISDGTPLAACASELADRQGVFALGINCTRPQFITPLIEELKPHLGHCKLVVYPNSGEIFSAEKKEFYGDASPLNKLAVEWLDLGVDILGGCCRVGPETIRDFLTLIQ